MNDGQAPQGLTNYTEALLGILCSWTSDSSQYPVLQKLLEQRCFPQRPRNGWCSEADQDESVMDIPLGQNQYLLSESQRSLYKIKKH